MKEKLKKVLSVKFIIIRLLVLIVGVGLIYALKEYGEVDRIYIQIFMPALIFATGYALFFSRNWTNWLYYVILLGLVVYFIMYKGMTVNSMKFYLTGQAIAASMVLMFFYQIYRLLKKYRII